MSEMKWRCVRRGLWVCGDYEVAKFRAAWIARDTRDASRTSEWQQTRAEAILAAEELATLKAALAKAEGGCAMKAAKRGPLGWPWLVVFPQGTEDVGSEAQARALAGSDGVAVRRVVARAAPDLLAACKEAIAVIRDPSRHYAAARAVLEAAVAKAEGGQG